jgi:hypothetical protein
MKRDSEYVTNDVKCYNSNSRVKPGRVDKTWNQKKVSALLHWYHRPGFKVARAFYSLAIEGDKGCLLGVHKCGMSWVYHGES